MLELHTHESIDAIDAADWNEALSRFAESAAAFERAGNEVAAWTARNNASEILTDQGRDDEARAILTEARRVFAAAGQRFCLALATSGLSRIELRAGDLDRAERLNGEALEMCTQLGVRPYVLDTEVRRVEWLVFADRADEALAKADDLVVAIAAEEATSGPTGNLSLNLARFRMWALLTQARFGDARRVADELLDRARAAGAVYEEAMAYDGRARIAERTGTNPQADRRAADQLFDRLGVVRIPGLPTTTKPS
jgi:tetratricopeptide (TPR) repeat protein